MQWWLSVFFFINGAWVPGAAIEGWGPRAYPSEAQCLERKAMGERECRDHPLKYEAVWVCSAGAPASAPPAGGPQIEC